MRQIRSFILASGSPRRRRLLEEAGLAFEVAEPAPGAEEAAGPDADAARRALLKARSAARARPDALALAADTVVVLEGRALGKPASAEDASRMLGLLSGRTHEVITAFVLLGPDFREEGAAATKVRFREIDGETIARYVKSGEPMDKAGAYAIQGAGGSLVDRVEGSYTNVVGLPLAETLAALGRGGVLARAPSRVGGAGMRR